MSVIGGFIALNVVEKDGGVFPIMVAGQEFQLEEGGEFVQNEHGEWLGGSLHIAFFSEFDLMLHVETKGQEVVHYQFGARLKNPDVLRVDVVQDNLDTSGLLPRE
ncbi:hypothetical protein QEO94_05835 [Kingella negevensis]|uniref:hypothetical protein n=1 Tax=Kingella negevensis TaxID=1522312 RepID=UPI00050A0321|nr:hypothetical protein [Kingella negevensis]MDK4679846.1 hypothetical protein [Kingella negevensis]MDK4682435.1 hypothetical protein [Kingella negevensis]MDK4690632.1 hypothetical protein [Kingella negevensis]MDK4692019.1 hypothetical protein [Kingella negevensis]MDK4699950.1 hypothetical protein [Kingella negevensis]